MEKSLALVLGGGGARGALQVGALRALLEDGIRPDLLVGTSAGAINAAYIAVHGFTPEGLDGLAAAWKTAAGMELLPSSYIRLNLRTMLRPVVASPADRIRDFFIANGMTPDLSFQDIAGPGLFVVSSDLNAGEPVLHGETRSDKLLDALLCSTALPPWGMPQKRGGQFLMDGAMVSGLPIEPAMRAGATDIIALDLMDAREPLGWATGFGELINKMTYTLEKRQVYLELQLAEARGVPVFYVDLTSEGLVPIWDFAHTDELITRGYELTRQALADRGREASSPEPILCR